MKPDWNKFRPSKFKAVFNLELAPWRLMVFNVYALTSPSRGSIPYVHRKNSDNHENDVDNNRIMKNLTIIPIIEYGLQISSY